jgi:hypothetical protein
LDYGSAVEVGNDHLVDDPVVLRMIAIGRELFATAENADDGEVVVGG